MITNGMSRYFGVNASSAIFQSSKRVTVIQTGDARASETDQLASTSISFAAMRPAGRMSTAALIAAAAFGMP